MGRKIISSNQTKVEQGKVLYKIQKRYIPPFLDDIPVIRGSDEDVCRILDQENFSIDETAKEWESGNIKLPFSKVAFEITKEIPVKNIKTAYKAQFVINGVTADVIYGTRHDDEDEDFHPILQYKAYIDKYRLVNTDITVSRECCKMFGEDTILHIVQIFFETESWREIQETFFITMSYLAAYKNIQKIDKTEIKSQHYVQPGKPKDKVISLSNTNNTENIITIGKTMTINLNEAIRHIKHYNLRKPCEFQFQRRGHWAQSKKTGKRWWVREAVVNADKPPKKTVYKIDME